MVIVMGNKGGPETDDQQHLRFQVELEFVQCLANPNYLNFLAQRGYFKDPTFVNYLKYLLYWKEPEYARYLKQLWPLFCQKKYKKILFETDVKNALPGNPGSGPERNDGPESKGFTGKTSAALSSKTFCCFEECVTSPRTLCSPSWLLIINRYPMCLYFLDLLQYEHFRREVVNAQCTRFIDDQQILLWQHYTRRRTRLLQQQAEQNPIPTHIPSHAIKRET